MTKSNGRYKADLLLVDDEPEFRSTVAKHFSRQGYRIEEADDGEQAFQLVQGHQFDVAVVDMMMPKMTGIELLKKLKAEAECAVILLTGQGTIHAAVEAMKLGAYDFLTKPARLTELRTIIEKACEASRLHKENRQLRAVIQRSQKPANMIGESDAMQEVYRLIRLTGPTDKQILIQGESGTGKELAARALHQASPRADKPLIVINCAALPEMLLESELFGHEKGAYTGATSAKPGLFEMADGGTLFIDEIGELAGGLQAKLLRVLEDGSLRRVGAVKERRVDVRLLTATNRDLAEEVKQGRFREDLYYRIDVMRLEMPPLRERGNDIALLARYFADDWRIHHDATRAIERFRWPGNVRQLINAIERAKILGDDHIILSHNLPAEIAAGRPAEDEKQVIEVLDLELVKRRHIEGVLAHEHGNKVRTARALGVSRRSLYRLLDKYEIAVS